MGPWFGIDALDWPDWLPAWLPVNWNELFVEDCPNTKPPWLGFNIPDWLPDWLAENWNGVDETDEEDCPNTRPWFGREVKLIDGVIWVKANPVDVAAPLIVIGLGFVAPPKIPPLMLLSPDLAPTWEDTAEGLKIPPVAWVGMSWVCGPNGGNTSDDCVDLGPPENIDRPLDPPTRDEVWVIEQSLPPRRPVWEGTGKLILLGWLDASIVVLLACVAVRKLDTAKPALPVWLVAIRLPPPPKILLVWAVVDWSVDVDKVGNGADSIAMTTKVELNYVRGICT